MSTILITGASSGIGEATAKHFQARGWNVVATMRTPENASNLATLDNIHVAKLDVTDSTSITSAVEQGVERFGSIEVLLNNAGYGHTPRLRRSRWNAFGGNSTPMSLDCFRSQRPCCLTCGKTVPEQ